MIELTKSPRDYSVPYNSWWPNQREMLETSVGLDEGKVLVIEAPPGNGKSANPAVVSSFRPGTTVLVCSRDLQQQYANSFEDFITVWGQEWYPCILQSRITEFASAYDDAPNRSDCPYEKQEWCPRVGDCPYEVSKRRARVARGKVLNYAYAYYSNWWRTHANDLFCDEAHRLSSVLSGLVSVNISELQRTAYGLPMFPFVGGGGKHAHDEITHWAHDAARVLVPYTHNKDVRRATKAKRLETKLRDLAASLEQAELYSWHVASGRALGKLTARPVLPGMYSKRLLTGYARTITMMSATIGDPSILLDELSMGGREYKHVTLPHTFPAKNRPVLLVRDSPRLSTKSSDEEYRKQGEIIAKLVEKHKGQKGIIHTVSWKHTKFIAEILTCKGYAERVYVPEGERVQCVQNFKNDERDLVAISPSWAEGLNFPDDQARFCIIAKIPFASLGDPIVGLRLKRDGGNRWYRQNACLGVVQRSGRIVRHPEDWGITYIVDGNWRMVESYKPKWFEVEVL